MNADSYANTETGFIGYNMFAYCNNNPVLYHDIDGENPAVAVFAAIGKAILKVVCSRFAVGAALGWLGSFVSGGDTTDQITSAIVGGATAVVPGGILKQSMFAGFMVFSSDMIQQSFKTGEINGFQSTMKGVGSFLANWCGLKASKILRSSGTNVGQYNSSGISPENANRLIDIVFALIDGAIGNANNRKQQKKIKLSAY